MKPFETELTMEAESPRVYRLVLTGGAFSFGRHFPLFLRPLRRCYGKSRGFLSHFIFRQASHPLCVFVSLSFPLAFRVKIIFFSSSAVELASMCFLPYSGRLLDAGGPRSGIVALSQTRTANPSRFPL